MVVSMSERPDGASWYEAVVTAGVRGLGGPMHGDVARWDWGCTLKSLDVALQRHARVEAFVDELSPEQRAGLWSDTSDDLWPARRAVRARA